MLKIPKEETKDAFKSLTPKPRLIKEFFNEKCLDLLSDTLNYEHIHLLTYLNILDKKCTEMEEIALLAEVFLP